MTTNLRLATLIGVGTVIGGFVGFSVQEAMLERQKVLLQWLVMAWLRTKFGNVGVGVAIVGVPAALPQVAFEERVVAEVNRRKAAMALEMRAKAESVERGGPVAASSGVLAWLDKS